jgi:uncharacterized membrane protein YphA (DoxX/SURF4 family)
LRSPASWQVDNKPFNICVRDGHPVCRRLPRRFPVLVRRIARPLLASTFIYGGQDALRHPETKAPRAEKLDIPSKPGMDKLRITTTEDAVRVNAAVQVAGGALLAMNKLPRLAAVALAASLVPTTAAGHRFWEEEDEKQKQFHATHFFKNLSMLGGLLIAAVDTEGKESLVRKTKRASRRSARKAERSAARAVAKTGKTSHKASRKAGKASGAAAAKVHDLLPV